MTERLRIAINAQLTSDDPSGGIVTVVRALAALTELDGPEEYIFVGPYTDPEWLRPLLAPGQQIARGPKPQPDWRGLDQRGHLERHLGPLRTAAQEVKQVLVHGTHFPVAEVLSRSDVARQFKAILSRSFFDALGCDVVHFPFQAFEACSVPSVYNPHDLQHLHFPRFFTQEEFARRENVYPRACRDAHTVVVASQFVQQDVIKSYGIEASKVQVIPWAPPPLTNFRETTDEKVHDIRIKYGLTQKPFALYPAMTWQHKNHLRLLEAFALLRKNQKLDLQIVCTGSKTDFWPMIEGRLKELGLNEAVKFTGLIPIEELNVLYRAAQFVFVPTLFEAASAPIFEAWQHNAPVACARVTSLPEQVQDAALQFDPLSVEEIVIALARMNTERRLREDLRRRGALRLRDFSLEQTAKAYRAVYRRAAGRKLNQEDRHLLTCDWTRNNTQKFEATGG
ncbi:MAG: glycosyltransferase family 1 protein [Acidobacteriota bacterium]